MNSKEINRQIVRKAKREAALLATRNRSLEMKIKRNTLTGATISFIR